MVKCFEALLAVIGKEKLLKYLCIHQLYISDILNMVTGEKLGKSNIIFNDLKTKVPYTVKISLFSFYVGL